MTAASGEARLTILDGWRAVSILLVLSAHLLPLDVIVGGLNDAAGVTGMAIFFTLSGFLITRFLLERPDPATFLIRRLARIVPLAWVAILLLFLFMQSERSAGPLLANLLFLANIPPVSLLEGGGHLWSLCVEMHFYVGVAILVALAGSRGLLLLPLATIGVTILRISQGQTVNIVSWFRIDEILAGATVALIYTGHMGETVRRWLQNANFYLLVALMLLCCFFVYTPLAYARPYAVAALVGVTLWHAPRWLEVAFNSRAARYIAEISYALYVVHGVLTATWLGSGDTLEKYLKRVPLLIMTFGLAHISTFYWERRFTDWAKAFTRRPVATVST